MENIQTLLCETQYKGKLTKRLHHSKPFNCSNHWKPFMCSFGGENLVGIGKFCIIYNVETLYCFEVSIECESQCFKLGFPMSKKNHLFFERPHKMTSGLKPNLSSRLVLQHFFPTRNLSKFVLRL